ncbi:TonB-dependent receptor [Crocosphaera chwakensis]|uniref:Ferrichrome-iron receptor n=1 Tax=Crocosphaera chwakensis CCY0110 TaxID=391612 RepID=A3ISB9_9CHRO|nr:TonB-dependent receptor [Crocosphaera chwakensis]EAZ90635.1 ferrichrome-iron receptor [Crocosphaera chwakensis CCY0110]
MKLNNVVSGVLCSSIAVCIAPSVQAQISITNIQINPTDRGIEIILETPPGADPPIFSGSFGTTFFAEISDAQLNLLTGGNFLQENPAEGIESIRVTQLPNNVVEITVIGRETLPIVNLNREDGGLVLSLDTSEPTPDTETEETQEGEDDEAIELVVTDDDREDDYYQPDEGGSTAVGTDTPLRDIPFSVQTVPEEVIRDQQVIRLDDALRNVSGVQQNSRDPRGQRFQIRGFDSSSVLRDGFRQTFGRFGNSGFQDLTNVERVTVLKGPASILYGASEPGGVINIVTKQPQEEAFYEVQFQAGNRGFLSPTIDLNSPLNADKTLLYRINFSYRNEESFRDFDTYMERKFIAPSLTWKPSDQTNLTLNLEYSDDDRPADFGVIAIGDQVIDTPNARVFGEPQDFLRGETLRVGYKFEHEFSDNFKFENAFTYLRYDTRFVNAFSLFFDENTDTLFRSFIELDQPSTNYEMKTKLISNFNTWSIKHKFLVGLDLNRREQLGNIGRGSFTPSASIPLNVFDPVYGTVPYPDFNQQPIFTFSDTQQDRLGVSVQDQIELFENLKVVAGFRYDSTEQENLNRNNPNAEENVQYEDAVSPRVGIVYQPIEEVSLYGSYSESFYPNPDQTVNLEFLDPEQSEQYEIGIRAELLNKKLSINLAYFDITKNNVAVADPLFPTFSVAVGEQNSRGVELDIIGEIIPGLNVVFNYANITAEITEDNDITLIGNRLVNVPEHSANLWLTYQIQDGFFEGLGFGGGFNYVDDRFGDLDNSFRLESYTLGNAAIFYERDNWRLALNIRNVFDRNYIQGSENSRTDEIYPGEPFTAIGSLTIRF